MRFGRLLKWVGIWGERLILILFRKVNAVILVLVIKAMASMQHAKDKHTEQIRWERLPLSNSSKSLSQNC